jgi:hypothetical protein
MKQFFRFGVGMAIESVPFSMMSDDDTFDMESIGDEPIKLTDIWKLNKLEKLDELHRLADCFKHAVERGFLD